MFKFWLLDVPYDKQIGFQDSATPIMEGIIDLHHYILFFLIIILIFVVWLILRTIWLHLPYKNVERVLLYNSFFSSFLFFKNNTLFLFFITGFLEKLVYFKGLFYFILFLMRFSYNSKIIEFLIENGKSKLNIFYYAYFFYNEKLFPIIRTDYFCYNLMVKLSKKEKNDLWLWLTTNELVYENFLNYIKYCLNTNILFFKMEMPLISTYNVTFFLPNDFNFYFYNYDFLKNINLKHGMLLEIIWTITPSFILLLIAIPSFSLLYSIDEILDPVVTLKVIGHQWYWSYEYSDYIEKVKSSIMFDSYLIPEEDLNEGQFRLLEVDNRVVLPIKTHIRVLVTSGDVLHSWAIPSLGVKIDAVPGRLNQTSLFIKRKGLFFGQCSEICGVNHGFMPIAVEAVSIEDYCNWINLLK